MIKLLILFTFAHAATTNSQVLDQSIKSLEQTKKGDSIALMMQTDQVGALEEADFKLMLNRYERLSKLSIPPQIQESLAERIKILKAHRGVLEGKDTFALHALVQKSVPTSASEMQKLTGLIAAEKLAKTLPQNKQNEQFWLSRIELRKNVFQDSHWNLVEDFIQKYPKHPQAKTWDKKLKNFIAWDYRPQTVHTDLKFKPAKMKSIKK